MAKEKVFIITVDTEGDNLWAWKKGTSITTENAAYIPRFQELCEKYAFIPTYLTNYEMAMDDRWVTYGKEKAKCGLCEIGMHIHAWNSPPEHPLPDNYGGNAYVTEYPASVIDEKVSYIVSILRDRFEHPIVSSRSGRWATNESYFAALVKAGIMVDCSVTPDLDLSGIVGQSVSLGNDYRGYSRNVSEIYPGLLEVPMTTRNVRYLAAGSIKHKLKSLVMGDPMWLRPIEKSQKYLITLSRAVEREKTEYLEFMIHSSELMPGGSPFYKDEQEIECMYNVMEDYFRYLKGRGYTGRSLSEYALKWKKHDENT